MHPCPGNWVAIGYAVVDYARALTLIVQDLNIGTVVVKEQVASPKSSVVHAESHC